MEKLIIYDDTGRIYYCAGGDITEPQGLPFLKVTIPENKILKCVDTTGDVPEPIFEEMPKSDTAILKDNMRDIIARLDYIELVSDIEE